MSHDFESFCRDAGLLPRDIVADGHWRRCPTESHPRARNGAYKLSNDGGLGLAQDWAIHSEPLVWRPGKETPAHHIDYQAIERRREGARRKLAQATAEALEFYQSCQPLIGGHPYLHGKNLDMAGGEGLRLDRDGWIVIPMWCGRRFSSVQRISDSGEKRFWPGASTKGAQFNIERHGAALTVLCEGLATGLAIFAAVPTCRVIVAFNAGNLVRVAETLPRRGMAVVAADNDHATESRIGTNPGLKSAQEAAGVLGCSIAAPTGIIGTDWLDYRNERVAERIEVAGATMRRGQSESSIRRAVDAEISAAMMRGARLLREVNHG